MRTGRTSVEKALRTFCKNNALAWQGLLVETDTTLRRSLEDRLVGKDVMQRLRTGLADGIVVYRPEHVFSSSADALSTLERWIDMGIGFHCVLFHADLPLMLYPGASLPDGEFVVRGLSELQRRVDAERAHQRVASRQISGAWRGRVPFGFHAADGKLVEDPDRLDRIIEMKRAHRRGASYRQIAQKQGISIATAHRLVKTDLRKLRRIGSLPDVPTFPSSSVPSSP
jgi:DNA invertase Pin-like site-specific DNA recombinase